MAHRAAVFLDRDGTVIEEQHYLSSPDDVVMIPGAARAVAALNRARIAAVVVTNQSGVARGYFDEAAVGAVHARMEGILAASGAHLDGVYYCPHLRTASVASYRRACNCRKPGPGMVERARTELDLEGLPSFVVGDKSLDLELAYATGSIPVLVRTGYGALEAPDVVRGDYPPVYVAEDLSEAVRWILRALEVGRGCA